MQRYGAYGLGFQGVEASGCWALGYGKSCPERVVSWGVEDHRVDLA